jgi:3-oxoadipate enol-lactonase
MHGPISALGVPVQFVVGEHDLITSPTMIREAQSLIQGARFHEIKGAGHSAYFERADEWNAVVGDFLASVPR